MGENERNNDCERGIDYGAFGYKTELDACGIFFARKSHQGQKTSYCPDRSLAMER